MTPKKKPCKKADAPTGKMCIMWSRVNGCYECHIAAKMLSKDNEKPPKKINKVSRKQVKSNKAVELAKLKVLARWIENYGYVFCSSCGKTEGRIDMSHLIPISDNKALEGDVRNILPQCGDVCHPIQERGSRLMKGFINYEEIMSRIKEMDENYYNKLKVKHES